MTSLISPEDGMVGDQRYPYGMLAVLVLLSGLLAMGMLRAPSHQKGIASVYSLGYLVGPTTHSLLEGHGLSVCTEVMGTPGDPICFKSARMPVASSLLALEVKELGDHTGPVAIVKTLLALLPLWAAMALVLGRIPREGVGALLCGGLLLLPMLIVSYLTVVTSMEAEEGYLFGLLTLALAMVLSIQRMTAGWVFGAGVTLALVFLCKSSMLAAVVVLLGAMLLRIGNWRLRVVLVLMVAIAPVSWAVYQHHASGRYSMGTSLDGMNLHKGNNADFLSRYPSPNSYLDSFDYELNRGHFFADEWSFNDYHMAEAKQFVLTHPGYATRSLERKANLMLFTLRRYNATKIGRGATVVADAGMVCFRMLLWSSIVLAFYGALTGRGLGRYAGWTYLAFLSAYCLPYMVGFGYIRHAVVLAYPAAVVCSLALGLRYPGSEAIRHHSRAVQQGWSAAGS